jgi:hypothetical protein
VRVFQTACYHFPIPIMGIWSTKAIQLDIGARKRDVMPHAETFKCTERHKHRTTRFWLSTRLTLVLACATALAMVGWKMGYLCKAAKEQKQRSEELQNGGLGSPDTSKLHSNGRTEDVQWDGYSLFLRGNRVFLQYVTSLSHSTIFVIFTL